MALKVEAKGGKGENQWDDGFDYDNVTKIHVRGGIDGIQFIKFEYIKAGKTIVGPMHGMSGSGFTQPFEINHSDKEYLLSVEGYYNESTGVIQSIQFKTNKKTSDVMGYNKGTNYSVSARGRKIIGFHGFSEKNLNSLGAYFIKAPSIRSEIGGGKVGGDVFDDGGDYDGVGKVYVTHDGTTFRHIKFDYDKAGQVESRERGHHIGTQYTFTVNYPHEYITSVEGTYAITPPYNVDIIRSLIFKTSKGTTSPTFGRVTGSKFVLESGGKAIVGFHGRQGSCINGLGVYYSSLPPTPPPEKLEGQGGEGGKSWDDGAFQNVKRIYIGQGDSGIAAVKVEYENDASEVVFGDEHGNPTLLDYEPFDVDYPSEYITSVQGCHDKILGAETGVITMLKFKTNKQTSKPFGLESASNFVLQKDGHKISGFHGKSSTMLHQIGVHVVPITE